MFKDYIYEVPLTDLDMYGHVNNARYMEIYELGRWDFYEQRGYLKSDVIKDSKGPIIIEANIHYNKELKAGEKARISTIIDSYTRIIGVLKQEIYGEDDRLCSTARFRFAYFDLVARKMIRPTGPFLDAHSKK